MAAWALGADPSGELICGGTAGTRNRDGTAAATRTTRPALRTPTCAPAVPAPRVPEP